MQAGWKDSFPTFVQELKNLSARDLSGIGPALKKAFDLLNQFRLQTGKDNYGQVRNDYNSIYMYIYIIFNFIIFLGKITMDIRSINDHSHLRRWSINHNIRHP